MNCLEFRRAAGADPLHLPADALAHARDCPACARYLDDVLDLDARIAQALAVPVPEATAPAGVAPVDRNRRRVLALAASVVFAVGLAAVGWLALAPRSLAADVIEHVRHEEPSWSAKTPVSDAILDAVMKRSGARFTTMPGRMMYVQSCRFRGHDVPHLVLETGEGPVTLLLLPQESVRARTEFDEDGYQGVLLPVGKGSIAVLTHGSPLPADLAMRLGGLIEWTS
jgi:Protein of unknown function (DUF3379)